MHTANVVEIKATTCQINSLHLYGAVKWSHLPILLGDQRALTVRGSAEIKKMIDLLILEPKKKKWTCSTT